MWLTHGHVSKGELLLNPLEALYLLEHVSLCVSCFVLLLLLLQGNLIVTNDDHVMSLEEVRIINMKYKSADINTDRVSSIMYQTHASGTPKLTRP